MYGRQNVFVKESVCIIRWGIMWVHLLYVGEVYFGQVCMVKRSFENEIGIVGNIRIDIRGKS